MAAIEDLYTRKIVGWSLGTSLSRHLVIDALNQAVNKENYGDGLIFHSDRGVQYASYNFRDRLKE
ncbi:hypothetical protein SH2C18_04360 [Clostridium sediminicola]